MVAEIKIVNHLGQTRKIWADNFDCSTTKIQRQIPKFETIPINRKMRRSLQYYALEIQLETTRKDFIKIVRLYTQNHDDDVIARKILPDIGTDPFNYNAYGTSLFDVAHYVAGIFKRILPDYPVDQQIFNQFYQHCAEIINKIQPIRHVNYLDHNELDQTWLNNTSKYNQRQKKHFHELLEEYKQFGPRHDTFGCNSFIKSELYNEPKFARIINSRSDMFKSIIAPYTKLIEERIFVDTFPSHFIKHHDPDWVSQRLKTLLEDNKHIYETDYSSFESSFGTTILQIEHLFFNHMLSNNPEIIDLIDKVFTHPNTLVSRMGITTIVRGTRMSGEMWTSLCNGFMNYCLVTFVASKSRCHCDFIVEGDDCAVAFSNTPDYSYVEQLGFKLKLVHAQHINDISFCGIKVRTDGKPVTDIMWTLHNMAYCRRKEVVDQINTSKFKFSNYLACVLLSAYSRCIHTPLLNILFYNYIRRVNVTLEMCKYYLNYWQFEKIKNMDLTNIDKPDNSETMYTWIEDTFMISKKEMKEIERQVAHITPNQDIYIDMNF